MAEGRRGAGGVQGRASDERSSVTLDFDYDHRSRTQLSLNKDAPASRAVMSPEIGEVVGLPEVGGMHHRYHRLAACDLRAAFGSRTGPVWGARLDHALDQRAPLAVRRRDRTADRPAQPAPICRRHKAMTFESAIAVLTRSRGDDIDDLVVVLCVLATYSHHLGDHDRRDDAIDVACRLLAERRRPLRAKAH